MKRIVTHPVKVSIALLLLLFILNVQVFATSDCTRHSWQVVEHKERVYPSATGCQVTRIQTQVCINCSEFRDVEMGTSTAAHNWRNWVDVGHIGSTHVWSRVCNRCNYLQKQTVPCGGSPHTMPS